jgi:hypothetical protein
MNIWVISFAAGELLVVLVMAWLIHKVKGKDSEARQLYFGSVVLTAMALVFMLGMAMYYWALDPDQAARGAKIFDACIHIIPPLLTLVIGFYFGKRSEASPPPPPPA